MKGNLKKSLSIFGALSFAFTAGFLLSNVNVYAATNQTLELNKDYYFDLNGDGQTEKIKYTTQVNKDDNDFFNSVSLFINDKNVYTKKLTDTWAKYTVLDIDSRLFGCYGLQFISEMEWCINCRI